MDEGSQGHARHLGIVEMTWRKSDFRGETGEVTVHHGCVADANDERLSYRSSCVPLERRTLLSIFAASFIEVDEQLAGQVPNEVNAEGAGDLGRDRPPLQRTTVTVKEARVQDFVQNRHIPLYEAKQPVCVCL